MSESEVKHTMYWILPDEPSGGVVAIDPNGFTLTEKEAKEIFKALQIAFDHYGADTIDEYNRRHANVLKVKSSDQPKRKRRKEKDKPGKIYVIRGEGGLCKIGKTTRPISDRLVEYSPKLPFETTLLCSFPVPDIDLFEAELHENFSDKHVRGEWFDLNAEDLEYFTEMAKALENQE